MIRKFKYILQIIPLSVFIRNWYVIPLMFLGVMKEAVLVIKNGIRLKITNFLEALLVKEVWIDKDYEFSLKDPRVIIDIGANIGDTSIYYSKTYPKSRIFSFEPTPGTFEKLVYNLKNNSIKNVKCYNLAVSGSNKKMDFYVGFSDGLSSLYCSKSSKEKITVKAISLDKLFMDNKIIKCDLLKIDCEGGEYEILSNCSNKSWSKIKNIVLEYHNNINIGHNHIELIKMLQNQGFEVDMKPHMLERNIGMIYAAR